MSVVDNIREIIVLRKTDLRRGYAIFQNTLVKDEAQLCQLLCRIFDEEEKEIEKEHQKSFVTDDYVLCHRFGPRIIFGTGISFGPEQKEAR